MSDKKKWHDGACHCKAITFAVRSPATVQITDCNCSLCSMTGYQHLIVEAEDFKIITGADHLSVYTFGTHTAQHSFCKTCGVKPFYRPRSHPDGFSVNLRCVDLSGFDNFSFNPFDGKNWEKNIDGLLAKD